MDISCRGAGKEANVDFLQEFTTFRVKGTGEINTCVGKWGSSLTRLGGNGGGRGVGNDFPSNLLHVTQHLKTRLTDSRPRGIQYFSRTQLKVYLISF